MAAKSDEFTVNLPSDAGPTSNTSASFVVDLDRKVELHPESDWYVGVKELYLPSYQVPKTEWRGTITLHPAQSTAPYARALMGVKKKTFTFKYADLGEGGKVFQADGKTYTEAAWTYLKACFSTISTTQDQWLLHETIDPPQVFQYYRLTSIPYDNRPQCFVEPYEWGRLELKGMFNTIFKLPRVLEPIVKTVKDTTDHNFIVVKDRTENPVAVHRVSISDTVQKGNASIINNKLKDISTDDFAVSYVATFTKTMTMSTGETTVTIPKPTLIVKVKNTSQTILGEVELHPRFFAQLGVTDSETVTVVLPNWAACENNLCMTINGESVTAIVVQNQADHLVHSNPQLSVCMWEWTSTHMNWYLSMETSANLVNYSTIYNIQIFQQMPLVLDHTQKGVEASSRVDTRVECPGLIDSAQQYFTQPKNKDLLRRVSRRLKKGSDTQNKHKNSVEEVQFINMTYHKITDNPLKRLRVKLTEDDHDLDTVEEIRYPSGSKSMLTLTFQPRPKRVKMAEEHTFQMTCNKEEPLRRTLYLSELNRPPKMGLIDVWLTNKFQNVFAKEMWVGVIAHTVNDIPEANRYYLPAGNYQDFDADVIPLLRRYFIKLGLPMVLDKEQGVWKVKTTVSYDMGIKLVLNEPLAEMLGHPSGANKDIRLTSAFTSLEGAKGVDVYGGFRLLYLYCDMVQHSIVGSSLVPYLDTIAPEWDENGECYIEISNPNFIPFVERMSRLDKLKVSLTDSLSRDLVYETEQLKPRVTVSIRT